MAKLRHLLALMTVVLHLAALLVPATAHAAMDHAAGVNGAAYAQIEHHAQPDQLCCATTGGDDALEAGGLCAICVVTCFGMQATLEAARSVPVALFSTCQLTLAERTLPSAAPEAALRPPRTRS